MNIGTTGSYGEKIAVKYLKKQRYHILCQNYQTRFGEVDIVAKNKTYLVFCEVKTRSADALVSGREAVDVHKQRRIIKAAEDYLCQHPDEELQPRFDVITVTLGSQKPIVEHIENAFEVT